MAEIYKVDQTARKFLFEGVQGENEARSIQFDITPWTTELGNGAVTATAKRPTDAAPYPVAVTRDGNTVTWKPTSTDTAVDGAGMFQLEYTVDDVLAKTCIWSTMVAPSLDPAGDPPDPYDNWLAEMREIAADAIQAAQDADESADDAQAEVYEAEAWAKGTKNGTPVSSSDAQYQNNAKYFAEESYKNAEAWAVGQRGGVDVPSTDPTYENNAKYYAEQSAANQYGAYIVKSASGDIASFNDGGDDIPMKSVNVTITPKQAGSGDPSPDNVRPIAGWTDADVTVAGKNIINSTVTSQTISGITVSVNNGVVTLNGTASSQVALVVGTARVVEGKNYILSGMPSTSASNKYFLNLAPSPSTGSSDANFYAHTTFTPISNLTETVRIYIRSGQTVSNLVFEPMIRFADDQDATYQPYTGGTTTPVPLGQTVYGGTVNPISGELVIDKAMVDMGSLPWAKSTLNRFYAEISNAMYSTSDSTDIVCDRYASKVELVDGSLWLNQRRVYVVDSNYSTPDAFKTAVTGGQLVYPLATPTTVQLTPTQVATLLGTNNVWADCGSVAVEYRADPTLAYAELQALILENL